MYGIGRYCMVGRWVGVGAPVSVRATVSHSTILEPNFNSKYWTWIVHSYVNTILWVQVEVRGAPQGVVLKNLSSFLQSKLSIATKSKEDDILHHCTGVVDGDGCTLTQIIFSQYSGISSKVHRFWQQWELSRSPPVTHWNQCLTSISLKRRSIFF